ncbi:MAG: hypothetical protein Q8L29_00470, partial [archaeon]|nr:hypothetical protein [archaeon]
KFRLDETIKGYNIIIGSYSEIENYNCRTELFFNTETLDLEDYNSKIDKRIGLIVLIISVALFSVTSAVSNIKKILKN